MPKKVTPRLRSGQAIKTKKAVGMAALGVAAAAALGGFFLYGTDQGKKTRKQVRGWMLKAKGDVLHKVEKAKHLDRAKYLKIVATVVGKYKKAKDIDRKDVASMKRELTNYWKHVQKAVKSENKKVVKRVVSKVRKKLK